MAYSLSQIPVMLETYHFIFFNPPDRLKCIICHNVLKNAKQTQCGCKACENCILNYLSGGSKPCPSKQPDCASYMLSVENDVNQDNATNKEIGNLKVKCPFNPCLITDSLKNFVNHVLVCEYRIVTCLSCSHTYIAKDKFDHENNKCEKRKVICAHCRSEMMHQDLSFHLNIENDNLCSMVTDICPNNCSVKKAVNLKKHLIECVNKKLECPYHSLGCDIGKLPKESLIKHLQEENIKHVSSLTSKIVHMETIYENLLKELKKQSELIQELFKINEKSSTFRINSEKAIEELKKKTITPTSIQTIEKNTIFRNAAFIWKFTEFEARRMEAENGGRVSVTSDPFYTSEFGYKMCLRIYPAGDGVGKGNFLSVFFAIMQGDFDDLLFWPFKQKVTLSILDQEGVSHHSDTFKPDSRSACYQKPIEDCNIASGSPKFISREQVTGNTKYYKNDTIYIKISVDTIGISKP